jgi:PAS domain S-box-containing protein
MLQQNITKASIGVLVAEATSGTIRSVNEHCCRLFRYSRDQLIGQNVKLLMEDAYAEEHDGYAQIHIAAGIKTVSLPVVFEEMKKCTLSLKEVATTRIVSGKRRDGSLLRLRLGLSLEPSDTCALVCALLEELDDRAFIIHAHATSGKVSRVEGNPYPSFGITGSELQGHAIETIIRESNNEHRVGVVRNLQGTHCSGQVFPVAVELTERSFQTVSLLVTEIDSTLEGLVNVDALGIISSVSASCRLLFGFHADEMIGKPFGRFCQSVKLTSGRTVVSCEHKDKSQFFLLAAITEYDASSGMKHYKAILRRSLNAASLQIMSLGTSDIAGLVGWYEVAHSLGSGFFGDVRMATHRLTGLDVAVKTLEKEKYAKALMSFPPREIELLWNLKHPNIVHLYDILYAHDAAYLIMEVVGGGELLDYVLQSQQLLEDEARTFFRQIISAVDYMHRSGIVHRDLKLENILLDRNGRVKIIDLGLGNFFDKSTLLSTFCGTPDYSAPELWSGKNYTGPEVDIWSLGVVLYAMVTGSVPFGSMHAAMNIQYTVPEKDFSPRPFESHFKHFPIKL